MAEVERVLLLNDDGTVDVVKRVIITRTRNGEQTFSFDESNVEQQNILDGISGTTVGNGSGATRLLKQLKTDLSNVNDELSCAKQTAEDLRTNAVVETRKRRRMTAECEAAHVALQASQAAQDTLRKQRIALEEDKMILREKVSAVQARNDQHVLALKAAGEKNMTTIYDDDQDKPAVPENETPSLWQGLKTDVAAGLKMGGGMAATQIASEGMTKVLQEAGVPLSALKHPALQVLIQVGSPAALKAIASFVPGVKDNKVVQGVLAAAQRAAVANVSQAVVKKAYNTVLPVFGALMASGSEQKKIVDVDAFDIDVEEAKATLDDA